MMTPMQRRAMLFIEAEMERCGGTAPSLREIARHLRCSLTNTHRLLTGLEGRGFIGRDPRRPRSIEIIRPASRFKAYRFNDATKEIEAMGTNRNPEG